MVGDIVQSTVYLTDIAQRAEVDDTYGAFFADVRVLPARAMVPVKELAFAAHIEIQAVAFLGQRP